MIELPEAITLAKQMNSAIVGKTVVGVEPPTKEHKFCWFNGGPADYASRLVGSRAVAASGFGIFAELDFSNGRHLCVNDGVNLRLIEQASIPKDYQLMVRFEDGTALVCTVAMYGGIILHDGDYQNDYYLSSKNAVSPLSADFDDYYFRLLESSKQTLSAKAFLATEQRFSGLGNGVLQDILFEAGINPRRKIGGLSVSECAGLLEAIKTVMGEMTALGGRDTEKDLFGNKGGYVTRLSKNTLESGCPRCHSPIIKEAYLGGSVYYCPECQPNIK